MRKFMVILLILSIFFSSTAISQKVGYNKKITDKVYTESGEECNWTVMYYICGEVKGMDGWADPLIENLTRIKSTDDFNIIVFNDKYGQDDLEIFYINTNGKKIDIMPTYGWPSEVDSSDLNTLEVFCKQIIINYPSKYYSLIPIASGGTGWQLLCLNDENDGKIGVSIPDFGNTLKNIYEETGHKIDVVFTSCAMNMIEVVYEFSEYVNYVVGTQTCFSAKYLVERFFESVADLKNDTSMNPEQFSTKAVDRLNPQTYYYIESYYGKLPFLNQILNKLPFKALHTVEFNDSTAVVNLSNVERLVTALDNLAQFLTLNNYNCSVKQAVSYAWSDAKKLGKCLANNKILRIIHRKFQFVATASTRFIDIYHFTSLLSKNTDNIYLKYLCSNVMDSLNSSISAMKKVEGDNQYGLSIYFPPSKYNYNVYPVLAKLPCTYECLKFSKDTSWDEFLKTYLNIQ